MSQIDPPFQKLPTPSSVVIDNDTTESHTQLKIWKDKK